MSQLGFKTGATIRHAARKAQLVTGKSQAMGVPS
jgi:hypothetical protein